jgi:hypothetical protein
MTRALIAASSGTCPFSFSAPLPRTCRLGLAGGQRLRLGAVTVGTSAGEAQRTALRRTGFRCNCFKTYWFKRSR